MLLTEEACGGVCTPFRVALTGTQPRRRRGGVSNGGQNYDPEQWRETSLIVRMVQGLTDLLFGEAK